MHPSISEILVETRIDAHRDVGFRTKIPLIWTASAILRKVKRYKVERYKEASETGN